MLICTEMCGFSQKPSKKMYTIDILILIDMILERFHCIVLQDLGHLSIFILSFTSVLYIVYQSNAYRFYQVFKQNQKKEVLPATTAELYVLIYFCIQEGYLDPANSNMTVDAIRKKSARA